MSRTVSNNEIKLVRSLGQKKFRDIHGMFVVEGEKMVEEALRSSFEVVDIFRASEVGETAMERLSLLSSPSPALAIIRKPEGLDLEDIASFKVPTGGLFIALDGIRDPGNLGTILRTADWFGIDGVFASPDTVDLFNQKVVQATMGAVFRVKFHYCDLPRLFRRFSSLGGSIYGTFLDGEPMYGKDLCVGENAPAIIVIGNESNGISAEVASEVTERLLIPSYSKDGGGSESLNAAVAAAVTMAEFRRRTISKQTNE